jgi:hypothetical protein
VACDAVTLLVDRTIGPSARPKNCANGVEVRRDLDPLVPVAAALPSQAKHAGMRRARSVVEQDRRIGPEAKVANDESLVVDRSIEETTDRSSTEVGSRASASRRSPSPQAG